MKPSDIPTPTSADDEDVAAAGEPLSSGAPAAPPAEDRADSASGGPASAPDAELAAVRDRWLRAEADLQNYRRRAQRDLEEARRATEDRALLELIEFLDDLDRALAAARESNAEASWIQGVELVAQRMRDSLARAGVTPVSPVGEPFDPRSHEALIELPAPAGVEPGTVMHVERTGYRRGDRMLRAARVTVASAAPGGG